MTAKQAKKTLFSVWENAKEIAHFGARSARRKFKLLAGPGKKLATPPPVTNSIVETLKVSAREAIRQNNLVVILWKYVGTLEKAENC